VTVEVDPSDLEFEMYYRDEKCQELESILRSNSKYAECMVKRIHWTEDGTDPFDVLDENEESVVLLETWETETLDPSDLLSYIEVKQKIDTPLSDADAMLYGAFGALGLTVVALVLMMVFYGPISGMEFIAIPVYILTPILGIISIRTYRRSILEKKSADLEAVRSDPSFLNILQRLAHVPEIDEASKKKLMKRIDNIENAD
jgi:hypothetical protein